MPDSSEDLNFGTEIGKSIIVLNDFIKDRDVTDEVEFVSRAILNLTLALQNLRNVIG